MLYGECARVQHRHQIGSKQKLANILVIVVHVQDGTIADLEHYKYVHDYR
jgi:hypothetical protein